MCVSLLACVLVGVMLQYGALPTNYPDPDPVYLCVFSGPVNQTSLKWELNANSSKTDRDTDFEFDTHVSRDSPDMTP